MTERTERARVIRLGAGRERALFLALGVVIMLVVGLGAALMSRSVAQEQAIEESELATQRLSEVVVQPLIAGYLDDRPGAKVALDAALRQRMAESHLTEVTIWSAEGQVLYSDNPE